MYFVNYSYDNGNCCGIITIDNLDFGDMQKYYEHQNYNGCLYKKISIDKNGNIKNCLSMQKSYGNISQTLLSDVLRSDSFKELWKINKDVIKVCNKCEFRYNCSDCRAFKVDTSDIYSKPLKCKYNPETCQW